MSAFLSKNPSRISNDITGNPEWSRTLWGRDLQALFSLGIRPRGGALLRPSLLGASEPGVRVQILLSRFWGNSLSR